MCDLDLSNQCRGGNEQKIHFMKLIEVQQFLAAMVLEV